MFKSSSIFSMRSPCNPLCLDLLMWSVANKAQLFRKVKLLDSGDIAAAVPIAKNDIVCYIPSSLIMSIDKLKEDAYSSTNLQLFGGNDLQQQQLMNNLSIATVGQELSSWWPGVTRGHFALLCLMTTLKFNVDGKGGGHAAHLNLLLSQEELLLESDLVDNAAESIDSREFELAVDPVRQATHKHIDEIRREMLDCFVAFERRSVVLYQHYKRSNNNNNNNTIDGENESSSSSGSDHYFGLPSFRESEFVRAAAAGEDNGVVRGLVPIIDLCTHSSRNPTCTIGFPDEGIAHWLAMERGVKAPSKDAVLLQAVRDIEEGELLTVNRGLMMGFDADVSTNKNDEDQQTNDGTVVSDFEKWFGHPY